MAASKLSEQTKPVQSWQKVTNIGSIDISLVFLI